jgi:hypothetical protein
MESEQNREQKALDNKIREQMQKALLSARDRANKAENDNIEKTSPGKTFTEFLKKKKVTAR